MTPQVIGLFFFAMASGTLMGTSQKFLAGYSPLLVNAIALGSASLIFVILYLFFKWSESPVQLHRGMLLLWLAFVGLNYGYSALYGHGVALAYVPLIVTGGMTILLGIVGYFFFQEVITWRFIIGTLVILVGMAIMISK